MASVVRNEYGEIDRIARGPEEGAASWIADDDRELLRFLARALEDPVARAKAALRASDADLARVVEDLIGVLIANKVILYTDLPEAAQHKLTERASMREGLQGVVDLMVGERDLL